MMKMSQAWALAALLAPAAALAAGVSVRFDLHAYGAAPLPSDRYTLPDASQNTGQRVALPLPDCTLRPNDCADIGVLNQFDGFSTQPRITVPFDGAIDPASVNSRTIYLLSLGSTLDGSGAGARVGINQAVWDLATRTLAFESDELLAEHTRWLLVVTDGVRDANGKKLKSGGFGQIFGIGQDAGTAEYRRNLRDAMQALRAAGGAKAVAASLFTTQSAVDDLAKIMHAIKAATPSPVSFMAGVQGGVPVRSVFALAQVAGIQFNRQTGTAPVFASGFLPTPALNVVPGAVAQVAYGTYTAPNYQTAARFIPPTGTLTGTPQVQGQHQLTFQLFVPAGPKPPGGWPVAIFGHGFTDSMYGAPWTQASVYASRGLATLAINVVGHGGGALGNLAVLSNAGAAPVIVNAGGRGIDQDGNGSIDSTEGVNATPPYVLAGSRDGLRQTVIDLMQLVRQVEAGMDIDGDGAADLNPQRIYYAGQSFGGIYGSIFLGVEPSIAAGVPNVPGGSITEVARLGAFRPLTGLLLAARQPSLINIGGISFNENIPLRDEPVRVNTVPGAFAIAEALDRFEWAQQSGNPVSYASYIRKQPLPGLAPKPVLLQFARGDQTVPNPTTSAILRAGDLADRATYFRNDLVVVASPGTPKNAHTFLTNLGNAAAAPYAVMAQTQIAVFFASHGTIVIDPDGAQPFFEVPIAGPLPERLNFIP